MNNAQEFLQKEFGSVHVIYQDGQIYFHAGDVANILGYSQTSKMTARIDDDEKISIKIDTGGGPQNVTFLSEAGLYHAIFNAQPEQAHSLSKDALDERVNRINRFKKWVTNEILPSITKYGGYISEQENLSKEQKEKITAEIKRLSGKINKRLEQIYGNQAEIEEQKDTINELRRRIEMSTGKQQRYYKVDYDTLFKGQNTTVNGLTAKVFGDVRTVTQNGETLFIASDVAKALGYEQTANMTRNLDADEMVEIIIQTKGGPQKVMALREPGVYDAIFKASPNKSTKLTQEEKEQRIKNIQAFKHKVTHEILPSVRQNGGYIECQELLPKEEKESLLGYLQRLALETEKMIQQQEVRIEQLEEQIVTAEKMAQEEDPYLYTYEEEADDIDQLKGLDALKEYEKENLDAPYPGEKQDIDSHEEY